MQLGERHPAKNMAPQSLNWHGADSQQGTDFMAEQTYIKIPDPVNYSKKLNARPSGRQDRKSYIETNSLKRRLGQRKKGSAFFGCRVAK